MTILTAKLWIVATPIGNLEDITLRATRILSEVDLIAVEDSRHSRPLLDKLGVETPVFSYHEHNEESQTPVLIDKLKAGQSIALISDAGTPLISDPGYRLVYEAQKQGISVSPVPGPSAFVAALSAAGVATDRFTYAGFAPAKTKKRKIWLQELIDMGHTIVFYESCHRIDKTLVDLESLLGAQQEIVIARELTKLFETIYSSPVGELIHNMKIDQHMKKGEFVVIIPGQNHAANLNQIDALQLARKLLKELPASKAARIAADVCSVSRKEIYTALTK
ncbi:MAG: 16S rRNA (cytidine(1402)-2'-O)-methyltransferase [bacterium]